jgi:hypothetical protein
MTKELEAQFEESRALANTIREKLKRIEYEQ